MRRTSTTRPWVRAAALGLLALSAGPGAGCSSCGEWHFRTDGEQESSWNDWPEDEQVDAAVGFDPGTWGVECRHDGLYSGGVRGIPTHQPAVSDADSLCWTWTMDYTDTGYEACCVGWCCTWDHDNGGHAAGQECGWSGECAGGMTCWNSASGHAVCGFGSLGDPCSAEHRCTEGLHCAPGGFGAPGTCAAAALVEGAQCKGSDPGSCAFPMMCVCSSGPNEPCACYDGSDGDLCSGAADCNLGLYCAKALGLANRCQDGSLGDGCEFDAQCLEGLHCRDIGSWKACVALLGIDAPCNPDDSFKLCAAGLHCDAGAAPASCRPYGKDGADCSADSECAPGYHCVKGVQHCHDGSSADPCVTDADCAGILCLPLDNGPRCVAVLGGGAICTPGNPYAFCPPGMVCHSALESPRCALPSVEAMPCNDDAECAAGLKCAVALHQCTGGHDASPCGQDADCAAGWHCLAESAQCWDGDTGDPCPEGTGCADGYECHPQLDQCFSGGHGQPCGPDLDCPPGLACTAQGGEGVCFEFLAQGAPCGAAFPFTACVPGTSCTDQTDPPQCAAE